MSNVETMPKLRLQERRVLQEMIQGKNNTQIAGLLFISLRRVQIIIDELRVRFDCNNTPQLIHHVIANKLLTQAETGEKQA